MTKKIEPIEIQHALNRAARLRAEAVRETFAGLGRILHLTRKPV